MTPSCHISPNEWMNYLKKLMNIEHIDKYENADMYLSHDTNQTLKFQIQSLRLRRYRRQQRI